ncbi:DUF389 domain-containing protein [Halorarum salinum]|uniref:DUF389 domain-containing protein n=1 Tax=Halorarum salinum TaxID=2743089 RepID=A0A7D5LE33_9EURY|nr:DUF389 domain-containing protein [Halobaculum salinum]QLG64207.1 DUF389 domain-containing protein [Halobaculum salinum]
MRQIQLAVTDDRREAVVEFLEGEDIDFITTRGTGPTAESWIVEFPLPTDAVGDVLEELEGAGIDEDDYVVVGTVEAAMTPHSEELMERYASNFDPIARPELRSKSRDLTYDPRSYYAMITISAVIAAVGLLTDSPAVIVGSMVIAPVVGPILTTGVGAVTDDRTMVTDSLVMQAGGLAVTMLVAAAVGYAFRAAFLVPPMLDVTSVESVSVRMAPDVVSVLVGLVAGAAAAYSLATKGPTALIGVMIAAALIPTAAAVGIGVVWGYPLAALGALVLLVATTVAINVGVLGILWSFGYRPSSDAESLAGLVPSRVIVASLLVLFVAVGGTVALATADHGAFERSTNRAVHDVLEEPRYSGLTLAGTTIQYGGPSPLTEPRSVTVVLGRSPGASYPDLAADVADRIRAESGEDVSVRVQFVTYQQSTRADGNATSRVRGHPVG